MTLSLMAIDATTACEWPAHLNRYGPDTTLTVCCVLARRVFQPSHRPSKCPQKEQPDMSDFERRQPRATRGASKRGRRRHLKSKGRAQTTRSEEDQQEHRQQYKQVHLQRQRELEAAAKARAIELANQMQGPITGIGPFNTFTLVQLLTMEFSGALDAILSPETLERDHSSINASARQKFAAAIKADKALTATTRRRRAETTTTAATLGLPTTSKSPRRTKRMTASQTQRRRTSATWSSCGRRQFPSRTARSSAKIAAFFAGTTRRRRASFRSC